LVAAGPVLHLHPQDEAAEHQDAASRRAKAYAAYDRKGRAVRVTILKE
jgi:hypothetical protein